MYIQNDFIIKKNVYDVRRILERNISVMNVFKRIIYSGNKV